MYENTKKVTADLTGFEIFDKFMLFKKRSFIKRKNVFIIFYICFQKTRPTV